MPDDVGASRDAEILGKLNGAFQEMCSSRLLVDAQKYLSLLMRAIDQCGEDCGKGDKKAFTLTRNVKGVAEVLRAVGRVEASDTINTFIGETSDGLIEVKKSIVADWIVMIDQGTRANGVEGEISARARAEKPSQFIVKGGVGGVSDRGYV